MRENRHPIDVSAECRVLVLAKSGGDARVLADMIRTAGLDPVVCDRLPELCREMHAGAGAAIVADEALTERAIRELTKALSHQPEWSDFPLIVMASEGNGLDSSASPIQDLTGSAHIVVLERPVRAITLLSTVRSALQARLRQYQVRDMLAKHRRTEEALKESEQRFRTMADGAPLMIWVHDAEGRQEYVNQAFCDFFGVDRENMTDDRWHELVHPEDRDAYVEEFFACIHAHRPFHGEARVRGATGEWRWLESWGRPRVNGDGEFLGYVGTSADVSDRITAEETLRTSKETLERKVAQRTEELRERNMRLRHLTRQLTDAESRERRRIAEELHDYLAQLLVATRLQMANLRTALSDEGHVERLRAMEHQLREATSYTRTLMAELSPSVLFESGLVAALRQLAEAMGEQGLTVEVREANPVALPENTRVLVYQCARELLHNCLKHAQTDRAQVVIRKSGESVQVAVRDSGCGANPDTIERGDGWREKFGLFSIRERVEALDGSFTIETAPGSGMTCTIAVPARRETDLAPTVYVSDRSRLPFPTPEIIRVCIVDDHAALRQELVSYFAAQLDIEVVGEAESGAEAIRLVSEREPDAMLVDINLPDMSGVEVTRRAKARVPQLCVVGLSIRQDVGIREEMQAAGAAQHLGKDSSVEEIADAIRRACGRTTPHATAD